MSTWDILGTLVGGYLILCIYSFLYKENPVYRVAEHLFIGTAMGVGVVLTWQFFLYPDWFKPLMGWDRKPWEPYELVRLLWLPPAIFGLGIYFMLSQKHNWIARCVIGFGLGVAGGRAFKGFFAEFLPQMVDSFRPLAVVSAADGFQVIPTIENWIFVVSLVCVMTYFFFSFEHDKPFIRQASSAGRWLMMITFGAFFGSTVMGRMALLIDRLQFLKGPWFEAHAQLFTGG